jgi:Outer membrane protein beta-barrel domain
MKKLLLAAFILLNGSMASIAQSTLSNNPQSAPRFRSNGSENSGFGLKGGINLSDAVGAGTNKMYESVDWITQYHFGAYAQIGITNRFSIQPELMYQRKGFEVKGETASTTVDGVTTTVKEGDKTIKLSYLSVPVLFVFNVFDNVAIQVGPQASYLLNVRDGGSETVSPEAYHYKSFDVGVVGGVEAKLEFLRFGARYDYSLTDLRDKGDFSISSVTRQAQSDIRNGVFQVYVGVGL